MYIQVAQTTRPHVHAKVANSRPERPAATISRQRRPHAPRHGQPHRRRSHRCRPPGRNRGSRAALDAASAGHAIKVHRARDALCGPRSRSDGRGRSGVVGVVEGHLPASQTAREKRPVVVCVRGEHASERAESAQRGRKPAKARAGGTAEKKVRRQCGGARGRTPEMSWPFVEDARLRRLSSCPGGWSRAHRPGPDEEVFESLIHACRGAEGSTNANGEYCARGRGTGNDGSGRSSTHRWLGEAPSHMVRMEKYCARGASLTSTDREEGVRRLPRHLVCQLGAPWRPSRRRRARRARGARKGSFSLYFRENAHWKK